MTKFETQKEQFDAEGYAVFPGILKGEMLELLRGQCDRFVAREDARMDALGVDSIGITHRGKRYFANECQREQPALRHMLFSETMADVCRATLGDDAYFFFDQFVVKGAEGGLPFGWHQDSGYVVGNGGPPDHAPYLTCWCPLDDATEANGTVRVLPFSKVPASREGIVPHIRQPGTNDLIGWTNNDGAVTVEVEAVASSPSRACCFTPPAPIPPRATAGSIWRSTRASRCLMGGPDTCAGTRSPWSGRASR